MTNKNTPANSSFSFDGKSNLLNWIKSHKIITASSVIFLLSIIYLIVLFSGLPPLQKLENVDPAQVTKIYSADNQLIHELFHYRRVHVPYEQIPAHAITAVLSTEDRRFMSHWGVDIRRIPRVLFQNIVSMSFGPGFSTISMQLARNLFTELGFEKTINRKLREILTAIQIERTYSKQEILEMYLNVVYFGHGVYGLQEASQKYFGKDARELNIEESATLIPLLNLPAVYSPINHPERSLRRRNLILRNMLVTHNLTQAEYDSLKNLPLKIREVRDQSKIAPYFTEYVRQQLNILDDSLGVDVYSDGLSVYTTLDTRIQTCMDSAVAKNLPELQRRMDGKLQKWKEKNEIPDSIFQQKAIAQNAFVALDHHNGHILAMTGGRDFAESKFNRAVQAARQPGSSFKAFLYTAALDNGYTPITKFLDQPVIVYNPDGSRWDPQNYDRTVGGLTTLRDALKLSRNLVSVRLIQEVGPRIVRDYAKRMGISTPVRPYPTLALGTSEVYLLDLTSAYGIYPNGGVRVEPMAITRIEDRYGNVIYEAIPKKREVLSQATAYLMSNMFETVMNQGTGGRVRWKHQFHKTAAGKTGTTNDYTDAWFLGFTPHLTAGVWVGLDDPKYTLGQGESGSVAALPFWGDFIKMVYDVMKYPDQSFQQPSDIISLTVCEESGKLATNFCPKVREEVFNVKYHPTESCDLHSGPNRNRRRGRTIF